MMAFDKSMTEDELTRALSVFCNSVRKQCEEANIVPRETVAVADLAVCDWTDGSEEVPSAIDVHYRLATPHDLPIIASYFARMLRELESMGHDLLPTPRNIVIFTDEVFAPVLDKDKHGIALAFLEGECIGASFFVPEVTRLDMSSKRAVAYGLYVHTDYRCQGVGRRLQALAYAHLRDLGFHCVVSHVLRSNKAGLASATSAGYRQMGQIVQLDLKGDS